MIYILKTQKKRILYGREVYKLYNSKTWLLTGVVILKNFKNKIKKLRIQFFDLL